MGFRYCSRDGRIVPLKDARINVVSEAALYGYGTFDTFKLIGGRAVFVREHLKRLRSHCDRLRLKFAISARQMAGILRRLWKANGEPDICIARVSVLKNSATTPKASWNSDTTVITMRPFDVPLTIYTRGAKVLLKQRDAGSTSLTGLKTINYLDNYLARIDAQRNSAFETVFVTKNGCLTEGTASNIFLVMKNGCIVTPHVESGILAGITRGMVIKLFKSRGRRVVQRTVHVRELSKAGEVFLTNSVFDIAPVAKIGGHSFSDFGVAHDLLSRYALLSSRNV